MENKNVLKILIYSIIQTRDETLLLGCQENKLKQLIVLTTINFSVSPAGIEIILMFLCLCLKLEKQAVMVGHSVKHCLIPQNHRMVEVGRDLLSSAGLIHLLRQGHPESKTTSRLL